MQAIIIMLLQNLFPKELTGKKCNLRFKVNDAFGLQK
jgi:hypothetical protein